MRLAGWTILLAAGWAVTTTCSTFQIFSDCVTPSAECPDAVPVDQDGVLFLVGDAGFMEFDSHPVMEHMKAAVRTLDERGVPTTVLFLGDNVYDEGVREGNPEDLRLLGAQVEVVTGTSARGIFLSGNHDRANTARDEGLRRIMNQDRALRDFSDETGADVGLMPRAGCPGPERENLENSRGEVLAALMLLDTSWWMLEPPTDSRCSPSTKEDLIRDLERAISEAPDVPIILAAHHPLRSGGPHGGNASSLRWLANRAGLLREDLNTPDYRDYIETMSDIFARAGRPVIFAAGHEHSLQVIDEPSAGASVLHLVSGSGSRVTAVRPIEGSRFAAALLGYMRLDFLSGGRVQLGVVAECSLEVR